jgi:hypothetical protein
MCHPYLFTQQQEANIAIGKKICDQMKPLIEKGNLFAWATYTAARHTLRSGQSIKEFNQALAVWQEIAISLTK